jgi:hypothetical protein
MILPWNPGISFSKIPFAMVFKASIFCLASVGNGVEDLRPLMTNLSSLALLEMASVSSLDLAKHEIISNVFVCLRSHGRLQLLKPVL